MLEKTITYMSFRLLEQVLSEVGWPPVLPGDVCT